jgi:molecular chaperone HscB
MHNYFELLSLEESFSINKKSLEEKYFEALGKYHPDRAPEDKKSQYASMSSLINSAYEALGDDFQRAAHILELHGININSDSTAPKMPLEILGEMLEMQEDMEEDDKRNVALEKASAKKEEIFSELENLFHAKDYNKAAIRTMELKYLERVTD